MYFFNYSEEEMKNALKFNLKWKLPYDVYFKNADLVISTAKVRSRKMSKKAQTSTRS